jgi:hypothetical protein
VVRGPTVTLHFTQADTAPKGCVASGLKKVELWRSANGARARRIAITTGRSFKVTVRRGSRYRFYTVGIDRAGNREATPAHADIAITATKH